MKAHPGIVKSPKPLHGRINRLSIPREMKIWLNDRYHDKAAPVRPGRRALNRLVKGILKSMKLPCAEMGLTLTGDGEIRRLNRAYRGVDRTTDVLAFPLQENPLRQRSAPGPSLILGDVVVSVPAARRQAREAGHSINTEIKALIIHGTLHLLGYDHERSATAARAMRRKERALNKAVSGIG